MLDPYGSDKAKLIHQILNLSGITAKVLHGRLVQSSYFEQLMRAKMTLTYCRRCPATPTRGIEALSMGCAILLQKDSVLSLYLGQDDGAIIYDRESDDIGDVILRVLSKWNTIQYDAIRGAEIIRREFSMSRVASQYLRFLTFLAARPSVRRRNDASFRVEQKRYVIHKGWLTDDHRIIGGYVEWSVKRNESRLSAMTNATPLNDMLREIAVYYVGKSSRSDPVFNDTMLLNNVVVMCHRMLSIFPRALVLRFNVIRAMLHAGEPAGVTEALNLCRQTLLRSPTDWDVGPMEDVFPYDFFPEFFNYRTYLDLVMEHLLNGSVVEPQLINLILASMNHYMGCYSDDIDCLERATCLDPAFPYYRLKYATQLIKRGASGDNLSAGDLLVGLIDDSVVYIEAFDALQFLHQNNLYKTGRMDELVEKMDRADKIVVMHAREAYSNSLRPALYR
jgi:hypothetical protein